MKDPIIEIVDDGSEVRAAAPPFHIWAEGCVHELVCTDQQDLYARMACGLRWCDDPDCDWCADTRDELEVVGSA